MDPTHQQAAQHGEARLPQLDGIRGIAVLMVVWWHYFNCQAAVSRSSPDWLKYLWQSTSLSWSGVDLFFVLSGFLITGILIDHAQAKNVIRVFFVRRAARILPLYILLLAFAAVAYSIIGQKAQFSHLFDNPPSALAFLTFTQNIAMSGQGDFGGSFLGITWSLAVEEQFYLLWPFVALLCRTPRQLLVASLALCCLAPCLRLNSSYLVGLINMPHRMDSLLLGAMAAVLVRNEKFVPTLRANPRYLYLPLMALVPAVVILARYNRIFDVWNHTILGLFYVTILLHAVIQSEGKLARILSTRWLRWFGLLSYAIYMFHESFAGLLHGALLQASPSISTLPGLLVTMLSLALVLVASTLSMRLFESRFLRWGRRFKYERNAADQSDNKVSARGGALAPAGS